MRIMRVSQFFSQYIKECWLKASRHRRMIKLQKRVGRIGGMEETMAVAAELSLQTDVLENMKFCDVFLQAQIMKRR